MTEIEQKFFEAFGICKRTVYKETGYYIGLGHYYRPKIGTAYPEITDRILLELICMLNPYAPAVGDTPEDLKEMVLDELIGLSKHGWFKNKNADKVRALFGVKNDQV